MDAVEFKGCNVELAKNQKEYKTLPAFHDKENGIMVTCYKLSFKELLKVVLTRKVWLGQMTFNGPLQPQKLSVNRKDFLF